MSLKYKYDILHIGQLCQASQLARSIMTKIQIFVYISISLEQVLRNGILRKVLRKVILLFKMFYSKHSLISLSCIIKLLSRCVQLTPHCWNNGCFASSLTRPYLGQSEQIKKRILLSFYFAFILLERMDLFPHIFLESLLFL